MSCNPAIGGIGKGHLVKEIDALGGAMALAADRAGIQFRTLNASKGPAVRATRAQADRQLYKRAIRRLLETQPNLRIFQQEVADLRRRGRSRRRAWSRRAASSFAPAAVVLTVGTFLAGRIHVGTREPRRRPRRRSAVAGARGAAAGTAAAGRAAEDRHAAAHRRPQHRFFGAARSSTATTRGRCSPTSGSRSEHPRQVPCHITATNERTHDIIRRGQRPLAAVHRPHRGRGPALLPVGRGQGRAFRRQAARTRSSSSPRASTPTRSTRTASPPACRSTCRCEFVRTITGFEHAHITRPGYAIEYDFFDPRDLQAQPARARPSRACSSPARSTAPPATRRPRRRACWPAPTPRCMRTAARPGARSAARPTSACWSTTSSRAARRSRTACSRAAPSTGCRCARTMRTCA